MDSTTERPSAVHYVTRLANIYHSVHLSAAISHLCLNPSYTMLLLHLLRAAVLLSMCSIAQSHFADPTVAAFPILPTASESHTVRLPAPSTTTCTFTYHTAPPTTDATIPKQRVDLPTVLSSLGRPGDVRGVCAVLNSNFWDYELCTESGVTQKKSGDQYTLGKQRDVKDTTIVYTGGDQCVSNDYNGPRETTVKIACDPTATTLRLIDISEPQTCRYAMTATTAAVCGDERFPVQTSGVTSEDRATEDWFMEVTSLYGDEEHTASSVGSSGTAHPVDVMCSVYSLEARATQSELNFQQWQLSINRGSASTRTSRPEEGEESGRQARSELVAVRHPGRRKMYSDEYEVEYAENVHTVKSAGDFTGQLAYVKLYA